MFKIIVPLLLILSSCSGGDDGASSSSEINPPTVPPSPVAIHGAWSSWNGWTDQSTCSASCGGGAKSQSRSRTCTNPTPENGGDSCAGASEEKQNISCNTQACAPVVDGAWSAWSIWAMQGSCTASCGPGFANYKRVRTCTNPSPSGGGTGCSGDSFETEVQSCNLGPCNIDGGWSTWSTWGDTSACSASCAGGTKNQERTRTCNNPSPSSGGAPCPGSSTARRVVPCNDHQCATWNDWQLSDVCDASCTSSYEGEEDYLRTCNNYGVTGNNCTGSDVKSEPCSIPANQCLGDYSRNPSLLWTDWGVCAPATTGETCLGKQLRTQNCSAENSYDCDTSRIQERPCLLGTCDVSSIAFSVCDRSDVHCSLSNLLFNKGLSAGNVGEHYQNRDRNHAQFRTGDFLQFTRETNGSGIQWGYVSGKNTLGNASSVPCWGCLSWNRKIGHQYWENSNSFRNQYYNNNIFTYPSAWDYSKSTEWLQITQPYTVASSGMSHSVYGIMEGHAYVMSAFKPSVKNELTLQGLVAPMVQWACRSAELSLSPEENYIRGIAHPNAFLASDCPYTQAMQIANSVEATTIPPIAQMEVLGGEYNELSMIHGVDTPEVLARTFPSDQSELDLILSGESSYDLNSHDLTYHWVVLKGDASKVEIQPINAQSSRVRIVIQKHGDVSWVHHGRTRSSPQLVIGFFVHNGYFYSPPTYINSNWKSYTASNPY